MKERSVHDFLALFGSGQDPDAAEKRLKSRPGMVSKPIERVEYPWGCAIVHAQGHDGFPPVSGVRRVGVIGRASLRRLKIKVHQSMAQWLKSQLAHAPLSEQANPINDALSGMYAVIECDDSGVIVLSDHMGFLPIYIARDASGELLGVGTHVEALAEGCGLRQDLDPISVAEMFVYNHVSFPYTTRNGIRELPPCACTILDPEHGTVRSEVLWEPTEPEKFASESEMRDRLRDALHEAGADIAAQTKRVGVLLSGGMDSRAVLAALPTDCDCTALTYTTRENNETRTAAAVAREAGVNQELVERTEDYYPTLVERGLQLLGMELRGNCHGLCISDHDLGDAFDAIVGGQLSDTLLKDHFMPFEQRDALRKKSLKQRIGQVLRGRTPTKPAGIGHTTGRAGIEAHLTPEMAQAVRERREQRLDEVHRVRPTTAAEWQRFWPGSRQDDSAHTLGNLRLFNADTLFAHQAIVEVARDLAPELRIDGRLADSVFLEIMGSLGSIPNANTGLPADASRAEIRRAKRQQRIDRQQAETRHDWNAVETSWVDPVAMQKNAPFWSEARKRLTDADSTGYLDRIIARGGGVMIGKYQEDLPSNTNHIAMQLALWLESIQANEPQRILEGKA